MGCSQEERLAPIAGGGTVGTAGNNVGGNSAGGSPAGGVGGTGGVAGGAGAGGTSGAAGAGGTGGVTPTQVFLPGRVYVQGRADDADCTTWVVADPEGGTSFEGGFACENSNLTVRPVDGALLYAHQAASFKLWEPDYVASGFPPNPASNDIPVALPMACENASKAWFQAESDRIYFECKGGVYSPEGQLELASDTLLAVGEAGLLLTGNDANLNLRSGAVVTAVDAGALALNVSNVASVRAVPSGFFLLLTPSGSKPDAAVSVTLDGSTARLLDYPAAPSGVTAINGCQLEPSGAAVCLVSLGAERGIARFDPDSGVSEVLYQEQASGVQLANARLFTGP